MLLLNLAFILEALQVLLVKLIYITYLILGYYLCLSACERRYKYVTFGRRVSYRILWLPSTTPISWGWMSLESILGTELLGPTVNTVSLWASKFTRHQISSLLYNSWGLPCQGNPSCLYIPVKLKFKTVFSCYDFPGSESYQIYR